jgi:hypothetical protein
MHQSRSVFIRFQNKLVNIKALFWVFTTNIMALLKYWNLNYENKNFENFTEEIHFFFISHGQFCNKHSYQNWRQLYWYKARINTTQFGSAMKFDLVWNLWKMDGNGQNDGFSKNSNTTNYGKLLKCFKIQRPLI